MARLEPAGFFLLRTPLLALDELALGADGLLARPEVRRAIALASPTLAARIDDWLSAPARDPAVGRAVGRYLARMASRPEPFGLFAGLTLGATGSATALDLTPRAEWRRSSALDLEQLEELAARSSPAFGPAPSLARAGGRAVAAAVRRIGAQRITVPVAAELEAPLEQALALAAAGEPLEAIAAAVARAAEATLDEGRAYLDELRALGLLTPAAPLDREAPYAAAARAELAEADRAGPLAPLAAAAPVRAHVTLVKPAAQVSLGGAPLEEIARGVELLRRITPASAASYALLVAFARRWGDEVVPLAAVLDEECGLAGASLDEPAPGWTPRDAALLAILARAMRNRSVTVALEPSDLAALAAPAPAPMPPVAVVRAALAARDGDALARGDFAVRIDAAVGGFGWITPFAQAVPGLPAALEALARAEAERLPGALLAQICDASDGRIGQGAPAPLLRDLALPIRCRSPAPPERRLALDDLTVAVEEERLVLRSRRHDRPIVPRIDHPTGEERLPIARLLGLLARGDGPERIEWSWGALAAAPVLPRVEVGRLVLSRARWRLDAGSIARLAAPGGAEALAESLGMPRWVELVEGEQRHAVDLARHEEAAALAHRLARRPGAAVEEMWPPPDRLLARGPEGAFVHDLVVPLLGPHRRPPTARPDPVRRADRLRPIGSDWLTLKLFGGRTTCDRLLVEAVAPAIAALSEAGAVDRWFFHRVSDPDAHLVVRLHGPPDRMPREAPQAIAGALAPLEAIGRTRPSVLEPYAREVARYGGAAGVALAEAIFCADSGAVCELLALIDPGDDDARFLIALRGADQLLDDLGLDAAGKRAATDAARARHFAVSPPLRRLFAAQHRRRRADREAALDRGHEGPYAPAWSVLARRSARIAPVTVELRALEARGALARPLAEQAWSYVHMFVNRLLRAPSLEEERALWDALLRSWAARAPVRGR